jgi:DnaJ-class molecular chaperone
MRPIRGCIQRGFCAAFPAPEKSLHLTDAILLFRRLGVDVHSLAAHEFTLAYFRLAKKYHPDRGNRDSHELMARINAARTAILKAHQLRRR